jgi:hypothetical protein
MGYEDWNDAGMLRERLRELRSLGHLTQHQLRTEKAIVVRLIELTGLSPERLRADADAEVGEEA